MDYLLRDLKLDNLMMQKLSVTQVAQRMCQATGGTRSSCYIPSVFFTISTQKDKTAAVFTTCLILSLSLFFQILHTLAIDKTFNMLLGLPELLYC